MDGIHGVKVSASKTFNELVCMLTFNYCNNEIHSDFVSDMIHRCLEIDVG